MKTGPDALGIDENECGRAKHENGTRHPRYRRKRSPVAQNMKKELVALATAENEFGRAEHENVPDALCTAQNQSGTQNMKTGPDTLGTAEKVYGRAKHENGTRRHRFRRKRVRVRKT
jgi:hypothetical protein